MEVSAGSQVAASLGGSASWGVLLQGSPQLCSTPDGASERGDAGGEMTVFSGSFSNLCTGSRREQGMNFTGLWMLSRWGGACEACCSWGARQERENEGRACWSQAFSQDSLPFALPEPQRPPEVLAHIPPSLLHHPPHPVTLLSSASRLVILPDSVSMAGYSLDQWGMCLRVSLGPSCPPVCFPDPAGASVLASAPAPSPACSAALPSAP